MQLRIKKIHLRRTDEVSREQIGRMVKNLLRRTDLLDEAILHDNNPVPQSHSLCLIMGDIEEGSIDLLAQFDNLCAHLITQLGVQVAERLVHQQDLGFPYDSAANRHTLPLPTG